MKLVWNGRNYRPVGNFIKVQEDDINELMKPLSEKTKLGSAILTGYVISAPNEDDTTPSVSSTPAVTPTPSVTPTFTPTQTQTNTPTQTQTQTNTPTPSITPEIDCVWSLTDELWENNSNDWNVCQPVISPTPTITQTNTPTNTLTPTPSSTPTFNPSSLNPIIWTDFSDTSTMTFRSGTNYLEKITNKGVYGGLTAFTQTTAANQPLIGLSTGFTGVSISAVTISNDYIQSIISTSAQTNITRVCVMSNVVNNSPWNYFWDSNNDQYSTYMRVNSTTSRKAFYDFPSGAYCRIDCSLTNRPSTGQTYIEYFSTSAATKVRYSSFNGSATTETQVAASSCNGFLNSPPVATLQLISGMNDPTVFNGEIGEILMFSGELTTTQTTDLLNYLKNKWGLKY